MENTTMKSAHLVDSDLEKFAEMIPAAMVLTNETLPAIRDYWSNQPTYPIPKDLSVAMIEKLIPGPAGAPDVRVIIFTPTNASVPRPVYLHIHGGGMVIGMPELWNYDNAVLAAELGCTVVSVDYRVAPEAPYPGPIEDCYAALKWVHTSAQELGIDEKRIAIGGDSAGGGLAAALAILARDRGEVKIVFQRLECPMLDDRTCVAEPHP